MDFQRVRRRLQMGFSAPGVLARAAVRYRWNLPGVTRQMAVALKHRYLPEEAYQYGLLDPQTPRSRFANYASRSEMVYIQRSINPVSWETLLADKGIFYTFCRAAGLPVPRLLALFFRHAGGSSGEGHILASQQEWIEFFQTECPAEFIIKPCRSAYGAGVRAIVREGSTFRDSHGSAFSAERLYVALKEERRFDSFVIQERLYNHPDLARLNSGTGLHTVRAATHLQKHGESRVVYAYLKSVVGDNVIDNQAHGQTGNLMVDVDVTSGTLLGGRRMRYEDEGFEELDRHPATQIPFRGFKLPLWAETLGLANEAARRFAPVRTVGWDVAITPAGPRIIEGNIWFDPPIGMFHMNEVFAQLRET